MVFLRISRVGAISLARYGTCAGARFEKFCAAEWMFVCESRFIRIDYGDYYDLQYLIVFLVSIYIKLSTNRLDKG